MLSCKKSGDGPQLDRICAALLVQLLRRHGVSAVCHFSPCIHAHLGARRFTTSGCDLQALCSLGVGALRRLSANAQSCAC